MGIPSDDSLNNLNRPQVFRGWYPLGFIDQFIRKIPFQFLERPTQKVKWNLIDLNGQQLSSSFYAPSSAPTMLSIDFSQTTVPLQRLGNIVMVDSLSETASGDVNDLLEAEIQAAKIAIVRTLGSEVINGQGTSGPPPPHLNGLQFEITGYSAQKFTTAGDAPTVQQLLQLIHMVRSSDGSVGSGADCIVTHERMIRYIVSVCANSNSLLDWIYDSDLGVQIPRFAGRPMYVGQIPTAGPSAYAVWALKIFGPTGVRILHATGSSDQFGIDVVPIPMQAGQSQVGAFVGGLYGLMVPEPQSIAQLVGTTDSSLVANQISEID